MLLRKHIGLVIVVVVVVGNLQTCLAEINRGSFPKGFVFGTASSAYQYEGAVKEDGRGPTIWDTFAHSPGKIVDNSTADVAVDHYHRYLEDIHLIKNMGMDAYRFSIAWTRIFPNGSGEINQAGIDHYNNLINALLANGIKPYVTLHHWDFPQSLEDMYKGWMSPRSIKDFAKYAETCFRKFGDRVKYWITFNEPFIVVEQAYAIGLQAPGQAGNSIPEPYIVAHNILLAHTAAADVYRKHYKKKQHGVIGMSLDSSWYEPLTNSTDDIQATQRALDFRLGWFIEPLITGNYPRSMRTRVGRRLPKFSRAESSLLKKSFDFIGINHYTTSYARHHESNITGALVNGALTDSAVITLSFKDFQPIGERANSVWLYIVPRGIRSLMNYIKKKYGNPLIMITENGMDDPNNPSISIKDALKDEKRIRYHHDYLENLLASIKEDGCNVKGYFAWSLMDNWEWGSGYTCRFGLYFVDYKDGLKRYPKDSVKWFKNFLMST